MKRTPKTRTKPQATRAHEPLSDLAANLGCAIGNILEHPDTCEWLRQRLAELHNGLMSEFACDLADDVYLRFAPAVLKACENDRPA